LGRGKTEKKWGLTAYFFSGAVFSGAAFSPGAGSVGATGGNNGATGAVALEAGMPPAFGSIALTGAFGTDKSIDFVGKPSLVVEPSSITDVGARVPWLPKTVNVKEVTKNAPAKIVVARIMNVVAERPDIMLDGPPPMPKAPPPSERCSKIAAIRNKQISKWTDNKIGMRLWIMLG
jgi:hypothetical protein